MAGPLLADAREHAAGGPPQKGRTHQHVDDVAAGAFIETPEAGRLSNRQPQSGHFKELRANSADKFVHTHHLAILESKMQSTQRAPDTLSQNRV
jgi:hypothetical protein